MRKAAFSVLVLTLVVGSGAPVLAATCNDFVVDEGARNTSDEAFAATLAETGARAFAAGCLEQADRLYEGANRLRPAAGYVYARILVREAMGDLTYARELLAAYRSELAADPTVEGLAETEARLAPRASDISGIAPVSERRSAVNTVGPLALAGAAVVTLGLAVYGFTASCELEAGDGTCLRGSQMAVGPTVAYAVTGVGALTAAAVWWILGTPRPGRAAITPVGVLVRF